MHPYPNNLYELSFFLPFLVAKEVETNPEDQLRFAGLTKFGYGGSNVDRQYSYGISARTFVHEITGVVKVVTVRNLFDLNGVELEQRDDRQPEKALHEFEGVAFPSKGKNADMLQIVVDAVNFRNVVRPTGRISPEEQQFPEYVVDGGIYSDLIDIEDGKLVRVDADPLNDPLAVLVSFFLRIEFDERGMLRFVDKKIPYVREYPLADFRRLFFAYGI